MNCVQLISYGIVTLILLVPSFTRASEQLLEHEFLPLSDMPSAQSDFTATTVDRSIYLIGGCKDLEQTNSTCQQISAEIIKYFPNADKYMYITSLASKRHRHSAAKRGAYIYIFGGIDEAGSVVETVEKFDTVTETVTALTTKVQTSDGAAFLFETDIYYCGGFDTEGNPSDACVILDGDEAVRVGPSLNIARAYFRVASRSFDTGSIAYAFGGIDSMMQPIGDLEILGEKGSSLWMLHAGETNGLVRAGKGLAFLSDRVYFFGGEVPDPQNGWAPYPLADVHTFFPNEEDVNGRQGVWSVTSEMPEPKFRFAIVEFGDFVYLFGGEGRPKYVGSTPVYQTLKSVHRYYEKKNIFESQIVSLHGSGTTNPSRFFRKWMEIISTRTKIPVRMTYRAVGSGTGQSDFRVYPPVVDFACGDIPLEHDVYEEITLKGHEVLHIPFALGTISVFANLPGVNQNIKLSPCVLARIYTLDITTWNHPEILQENPELTGIVGRENILVGRRDRGSSSTFGLTQYMHVTCPDVWKTGPSSTIPQLTGANVRIQQGSSQMTSFIRDSAWSIGYLDSGHGISNNLKEVALKMANLDVYKVSNDQSINVGEAAVGISLPDAEADWSNFSLQNQDFPAWPITMVSYFYIHRDMRGAGIKASLLKAFLQFVLDLEEQDEGQSGLETFGFIKLSNRLLEFSRGAIEKLYMPLNAPNFTFEVSTLTNGLGMSDYVISQKRNPNPFDPRDQTAMLDLLSEENDMISQELKVLEEKLVMQNADAYSNVQAIAIAALVISCLSFFGLLALLVSKFVIRVTVPFSKETEMRDQKSNDDATKDFTENVSRA